MNIYLKALAAGAIALAAAQPALAQTSFSIYAGTPVRVQQQYAPARGYYVAPPAYGYNDGYRHDWRARRAAELRRQEWLRREEWRREQWRREQWRREHHRHDRWDGRY